MPGHAVGCLERRDHNRKSGPPDTKAIIQQARVEDQLTQCCYCQSVQIMQVAALLVAIPAPKVTDTDKAMQDNLCRCGTYSRIRAAIHFAASKLKEA